MTQLAGLTTFLRAMFCFFARASFFTGLGLLHPRLPQTLPFPRITCCIHAGLSLEPTELISLLPGDETRPQVGGEGAGFDGVRMPGDGVGGREVRSRADVSKRRGSAGEGDDGLPGCWELRGVVLTREGGRHGVEGDDVAGV